MSQERRYMVVDIETMVNCFVVCGEEAHTGKKFHCVLWKNRNDLPRLFKFLHWSADNAVIHVTFNGLAFDSQIFQWMMDKEHHFLDPGEENDNLINEIYAYAQRCIEISNSDQRGGFNRQWMDYPPWKIEIPQCDLYKMGHWDSDAKRASLKWLQCSIDWPNLEDMPYSHTHYVENEQQLGEIISYCYNDVAATKRVFHLCKEGVDLRYDLTQEYGIDLYSASEPKMSKELFLHFLSIKLKKDKQELKKWNTIRDQIKIADILLSYIKFERQEFVMLLNNFKKLTVQGDALRGAFTYNVKYRGISIDYGMGGIHGMAEPGVYKSTATHILKSVDVKSFYPNLCINSKWSPAHIPKQAFCDQYLWFYEEREKHKKGTAKNKALKLLLNSTFGLSIDKYSFLSDPSLGVSITVNGQLLLTMLLEMLCEGVPDAKPIVMNTDGIEILIHKDQEKLFEEICKKWEAITKLVLEYDKFDTILGFDVNNYISKFENGKLKGKGRFEYEPHDRYEIDVLHKNKSFLVVPKGIAAYFFDGIDPDTFVRKHANIYDFCGFARARGKWKFVQVTGTGEGVTEKQIQKTLRYFVSKTGSKIVKRKQEIQEVEVKKNDWELKFDDVETLDKRVINKQIQVLAGKYYVTEFNNFVEKNMEDYNLDYSYYVKEIRKEINTLKKQQSKL